MPPRRSNRSRRPARVPTPSPEPAGMDFRNVLPASLLALYMIHFNDLIPNVDATGEQPDDWFPYRANHRHKFLRNDPIDRLSPIHHRGGPVQAVYFQAGMGLPAGVWHVMICDPQSCETCIDEVMVPAGHATYGGLPFVHNNDICRDDRAQQVIHWYAPHPAEPPDNSTVTRCSQKVVRFEQAGSHLDVNTAVCEPNDCTLCGNPVEAVGRDENGREQYFLQMIVDSRIQNGVFEYKLQWYGWDAEYDTWQPPSDLGDIHGRIINEFHFRNPAKPRPPP